MSLASEAPKSHLSIILASASPRRKQLLEREGVAARVLVSQVDESLTDDLRANPSEAVKVLAQRKAGVVAQEVLEQNFVGRVAIIGADTMVAQGGELFGKPKDHKQAVSMLRRLAGTTHEVLTGVSVWYIDAPEPQRVSMGYRSFVDSAKVTFYPLSDQAILEYLSKGESFDKAGAYAAQGHGRFLIERIEGDEDSVIGLPVKRLFEEFPDLKPCSLNPSSCGKM